MFNDIGLCVDMKVFFPSQQIWWSEFVFLVIWKELIVGGVCLLALSMSGERF